MNDTYRNALSKLLTDSEIITDLQSLQHANTATFQTSQKSKIIIQVKSTEDIVKTLGFASKNKLKIYVISKGKNWGFGSKVPVKDVDILVDLSLMNRIVSYDKEFGTVRVEPGVTFLQLSAFLRKNGSQHFLNVIGGDGNASVLGNILERGDGMGPYCERWEYACSPEVILSNGKVVNIGFGNIRNSKLSELCKCGIGPNFQELFFQSNFGIVTRITIWLCPVPKYFRTFHFSLDESNSISKVLSQLKCLYKRKVLTSPITFWNDYKQITTSIQYPWDSQNNQTPLDRNTLKKISNNYSTWYAFGGIYVDHKKIGKQIQKEIFEGIKHDTKKTFFLSHLSNKKIELLKFLNKFLKKKKINFNQLIDSWDHNPLLGFTTDVSIKSLYWRKRKPLPAVIDPDNQSCGVLWNSFVLPFNEDLISCVLSHIDKMILNYRLEPVISFVTLNDKYVKVFQQLIFDRENEQEDKNALICHREIFEYLQNAGYSHTRLDILSMREKIGIMLDDTVHKKIKQALDPEGIISPGRYFI